MIGRVFSLDHKVIGLQFAVTSMVFMLVGYRMRGVITVERPDAFATWLAAQR